MNIVKSSNVSVHSETFIGDGSGNSTSSIIKVPANPLGLFLNYGSGTVVLTIATSADGTNFYIVPERAFGVLSADEALILTNLSKYLRLSASGTAANTYSFDLSW